MSKNEIISAVKSLKTKNCEGHDRLAQRIIIGGIDTTLVVLFEIIYKFNYIPEQWLISKINQIFKKGSKSNIENSCAVSNLCSMFKFFEK